LRRELRARDSLAVTLAVALACDSRADAHAMARTLRTPQADGCWRWIIVPSLELDRLSHRVGQDHSARGERITISSGLCRVGLKPAHVSAQRTGPGRACRCGRGRWSGSAGAHSGKRRRSRWSAPGAVLAGVGKAASGTWRACICALSRARVMARESRARRARLVRDRKAVPVRETAHL